jgi:hypothetical protein
MRPYVAGLRRASCSGCGPSMDTAINSRRSPAHSRAQFAALEISQAAERDVAFEMLFAVG